MKFLTTIVFSFFLTTLTGQYHYQVEPYADGGLMITPGEYTLEVKDSTLTFHIKDYILDVYRIGKVLYKEQTIYTDKRKNGVELVLYSVDFGNYGDPRLDHYKFIVHPWKVVMVSPGGRVTTFTDLPEKVVQEWKR